MKLTTEDMRVLLRGYAFFGSRLYRPGPCSRGHVLTDAARLAWESHRGAILKRWKAANPGTRPWAWWMFDAPEPRRRCINRDRHPHDEPEHIATAKGILDEYPDGLDTMAIRFGVPRYEGGATAGCKYESEAEYLERHGLMDAAEREALQAPEVATQ